MPYSTNCNSAEFIRAYHAAKKREYRNKKAKTDPDFYKNQSRANYEKYPHLYKLAALERQKRISVATPTWANRNSIKQFYVECPEGCHVDHIIPIKGELVCGLHVENNLQYLLASDNIRKSNQFSHLSTWIGVHRTDFLSTPEGN